MNFRLNFFADHAHVHAPVALKCNVCFNYKGALFAFKGNYFPPCLRYASIFHKHFKFSTA